MYCAAVRRALDLRLISSGEHFLWRDRRVIVETDGFRHHGNRAAFEGDRARDAHFQSRGFRVLRFTYRQIREAPEFVVRTLPLVGRGSLAPDL